MTPTADLSGARAKWRRLLNNPEQLHKCFQEHSFTSDNLVDACRAAGIPDFEIRAGLLKARDWLVNQKKSADSKLEAVLNQLADRPDPTPEPIVSAAGKTEAFSDKLPIAPDGERLHRFKDYLERGRFDGEKLLVDTTSLVPSTRLAKASSLPLPVFIERVLALSFGEQLVQMYYPKVYNNVGAYHSPKTVAVYLANVTAELLRYGHERVVVT